MRKPTFIQTIHPLNLFKGFVMRVKDSAAAVSYILSFAFLLTVYLVARCVEKCGQFPLIPNSLRQKAAVPLQSLYKKLIAPTQRSEKTINRLNLIELAIRNMAYKRTRSVITIGGMAVGIAAIVFLVSIGFGLQELVVGRVARLDELKQADVAVQTGSKLSIDDKTLNEISKIPEVEDVLPLVAVVGRISYNDSISDLAVFGVTSDYLKNSALQPVKGRIFESNDLRVSLPKEEDESSVQGADTKRVLGEYGNKIQDIDFVIEQDAWLPVREGPSGSSRLLGYTRRVPGTQVGEEYWGDSYISEDGVGSAGSDIDGVSLGRWVKSTFRLWSKEICLMSEDPDCEENQYTIMRDSEADYVEEVGYIAEHTLSVRPTVPLDEVTGDVLGLETSDTNASDAATTENSQSTGSESDDAVNTLAQSLNIDASSAALLKEEGVIEGHLDESSNDKEVTIPKAALKEAVVNRATLNLLGIDENDAVGKTFEISFVVVDKLTDGDQRIRSVPTTYKIVGVDPESDTPFLYVPFVDLRSLGVSKYSQLKVIAQDETELADVRKKIEVLGYATTSVVDTVARITSFFGTLRIVLALVGGVALAVASLGMFNTLTVSLLERTREVGLMKAMGMKSYEVRELFLTESMIMGFFGGLAGITLGVAAGQILSMILSVFALSKGAGLIGISYTPAIFIALTMIFAMFVGLITGIYPARRATKISALNALRYE